MKYIYIYIYIYYINNAYVFFYSCDQPDDDVLGRNMLQELRYPLIHD